MAFDILPFHHSAHFNELVDILFRVRTADPTYPPAQDADASVESFGSWLLQGPVIERWVAVVDGRVVGHVALADAHSYLTNYLDDPTLDGLCEVNQLFVDSEMRGHGTGLLLVEHVLAAAAELQRPVGLAVVAESLAARRLYARSGLTEVGAFEGRHGTNYVFLH